MPEDRISENAHIEVCFGCADMEFCIKGRSSGACEHAKWVKYKSVDSVNNGLTSETGDDE